MALTSRAGLLVLFAAVLVLFLPLGGASIGIVAGVIAASIAADLPIVKELLKAGASVEAQVQNGATALWLAAGDVFFKSVCFSS